MILPNGNVETKSVTGISGVVVTLASALSATPNINSIWLLESDSYIGQTFRVISVEEVDGINYNITALTYVPDKYNNIEQGISLSTKNVSVLNELRDPPSNVQASERMIVRNNRAMTKIILSWVSVIGVSQYQVQYRFAGGNWVTQNVFRPDFEIIDNQVIDGTVVAITDREVVVDINFKSDGVISFNEFKYNSELKDTKFNFQMFLFPILTFHPATFKRVDVCISRNKTALGSPTKVSTASG